MSSRTLFALGTLFLALAGAGAQVAFAQTQPQPARLQAAGSEIVFTTRQMGVPVEGRFGKFSAQVALDPRKPETGRVGMTIDTASARFGSAELDAEVPKPIWLHAAGFPVVLFGVLPLPDFVAPDRALSEVLKPLHQWLAYALAAVIVLHVAAALKHHFVDRDGLLLRMMPARRRVAVPMQPIRS